MSVLRLYGRVLELLAPEWRLAMLLALANLGLAGVYFLEPMLFGRVVDALGKDSAPDAPRLITRAFATLAKGRTTFVIAHRLSTVRNADRILVLDRGRLVEQGRYEELIAAGGLFAELANQGQFAADADAEETAAAPALASAA